MTAVLARLIALSIWLIGLYAQNGPPGWSASPFNAPALPLAVRSPHFNSWLPQGNNPSSISNFWPKFWRMDLTTGWYISVIVDGQAYRIMGNIVVPNVSAANQTSVEFTPTRTSFLFTTGPMQINASFLSPIEPTDLVRQSLPFSYLVMSASSNDGNPHNLRMYSDISGQFVAANIKYYAQWTSNDDGEYIILTMRLVQQYRYSELMDIAQDSTACFSFKKINGTKASWAITADTVNRANAANTSVSLGNTVEPMPGQVQDSAGNWPTLGIEIDWGEVESTPQPAVWALGLVRSPSIQYALESDTQDRYPYFMSEYSDVGTAAIAFLDDFLRAQSAAEAFDAQLYSAGQQCSADYSDLLALSVRQLMGSLDITLSKANDGSWNVSDVKVFMKNMGGIGSDAVGTSSSVNTVDILYAAFPAFMYLNPELGGYLLTPLLEYQDSTAYTLHYAAKNIGSTYPNATADGLDFGHNYGVEESANMLIMVLAYSQRSGNGTLLSKHCSLLPKWSEYLENNTLILTNQISADFVANSAISNNNQTNLALKGIIGIACMAKIADIAGVIEDKEHFNNTASSYISQWQSNALAPDRSHIDFFYGNSDSNGLIYNLYADGLLQLNLISEQVYQIVTSFYDRSGGLEKYGLSLSNTDNEDTDRTTTNWMMFSASTVLDNATRNSMVAQIHNYAASSQSSIPFASTYDSSLGTVKAQPNTGMNNPACGAIFALLAIDTSIKSSINLPSDGSTIPGTTSSTGLPKIRTTTIVGGTIGGIIAILVIAFGGFLCFRYRRQRREEQFMRETITAIPVSTTWHRHEITQPSPTRTQPTLPLSQLAVVGADKHTFDSSDVGSAYVSDSNGSDSQNASQVGSAVQMLPSERSQSSGWGRRLWRLLDESTGNRDRLREDVGNLRREVDRLRVDLVADVPPNYSDPGAGWLFNLGRSVR